MLYQFIFPLGLTTFALLLITVLMGARVIKVKVKYHRFFGILTFIFAISHGSLAIYFKFFG